MSELSSFRNVLAGATGMLLFLLCVPVQSQDLSQTLNLNLSANDSDAVSQAQDVKHHARPANTSAARDARSKELSNLHLASPNSNGSEPSDKNVRYPGDLQYHGGAVVDSTVQHLIFVNLSKSTSCHTVATCWGNPFGFLQDLGNSNFIRVVDQYTGDNGNGRYTVSQIAASVNITTGPHPLTDANILAIVHLVASFFGTGYGNLYHVFLLPGQDECFDSTFTVCYSPDNPNTFFFCAYHGSATFKDIGHVLYSVEPFQNVDGCSSRPGTPNGQLVDSTNNVLSHETIEAITDPDGTAWWNSLDNALFGQEIADECSFLLFTSRAVYFDPSDIMLNGTKYVAQPEYNNRHHACTTTP
jgi:hypothetical protein